MPGYKTHMIGGAATFVGVLCAFQGFFMYSCTFWVALSLYLITIVGSLFPDIDTKSKGQMFFYKLVVFYLLMLMWYKRYTLFMMTTCVLMIPLMVPHRGIFHSSSFIILISAVSSGVSCLLYPQSSYVLMIHSLFFCAGAFSHIILDKIQTGLKKSVY